MKSSALPNPALASRQLFPPPDDRRRLSGAKCFPAVSSVLGSIPQSLEPTVGLGGAPASVRLVSVSAWGRRHAAASVRVVLFLQ